MIEGIVAEALGNDTQDTVTVLIVDVDGDDASVD